MEGLYTDRVSRFSRAGRSELRLGPIGTHCAHEGANKGPRSDRKELHNSPELMTPQWQIICAQPLSSGRGIMRRSVSVALQKHAEIDSLARKLGKSG